MPNSSRRIPRRRPAPKRFPRVALYAAVVVAGLALGATLVVIAQPPRTVAQAVPVVTPPSSPITPPPLPTPVAISKPAPVVPPAAVVEVRPTPAPKTPPAALVVAKRPAAEIAFVGPLRVPELVVKRMHRRSRIATLEAIAKVPALSLDLTTKRAESIAMVKAALQTPAPGVPSDPTLALLDRRADLAGLPFRRGSTCRTTPVAARELAKGAGEVKFLDHGGLETTLSGAKAWLRPERIAALMQVVMAQPEENRRMLARHLAGVEGRQASEALARIALFDPDPDVRRQAIRALEHRPPSEYRLPLLSGFASPLPVVAEHAAEALAALKRTETVPALLAILDGPDPRTPYAKGAGPARFVKEVVRVNHMINCLMCHPPSFRTSDPARAPVPPLPPLREPVQKGVGGYGAQPSKRAVVVKETFIRADITYLKQDYSVILGINATGVLKGQQRYDLLVRERLATPADLAAALVRKNAGPTGQQKAVAFALRELTGQEPGAGFANWLRFAQRVKQVARQQ